MHTLSSAICSYTTLVWDQFHGLCQVVRFGLKVSDWLRPVSRTTERGYILLEVGKICQLGKEFFLIKNKNNESKIK
jgi:hypothetical protein